jgi:hypothetical protein
MTDNQKANLKISLIPLVVIIGLILGAGYLLLAGDIKLPQFNNGPQFRRVDGFPTVIYTDKVIEKQRIVIKSEEELTNFLNMIDPTGLLEVRETINFNKEYLIAVTTETEQETNRATRIKKIYEDKEKGNILVSVRETEPGKTCEIEIDPNVAVDIVAISKTELPMEFERIKQVEECK